MFLIKHKDSRKSVLKTYTCTEEEEKLIEFARKEYDIMRKLAAKSHHTPKPISMAELRSNEKVYIEILYEYYGEPILEYLKGNVVKPSKLLALINQSVSVLEVARQSGIFHPGIMPDKIYSLEGELKLVGFEGSTDVKSVLTKEEERLSTQSSSPQKCFLPPELQEDEREKASVFSWGITIYQILSSKTKEEIAEEYKQNSDTSTNYSKFLKKIEDIVVIGENAESFQKQILPILQSSLARNPTDRPTFAALLQILSDVKI